MSGNHKREPCGNTCPDIDRLKGLIRGVSKSIEDRSDIRDLDDVDSGLEDLRAANMKLRNWGIEEATEVDKLTARLNTAEDDYSTECTYSKELEEKIKVLEEKLKEKT